MKIDPVNIDGVTVFLPPLYRGQPKSNSHFGERNQKSFALSSLK
jgi:hypothetical protein